MTNKGDIFVFEAWGSFLVSREIHIGVHYKTLNKCHVEVYCPAQFARQFVLVQAVPLPFVGTSNVPIHKHFKLGQDNTKRSNLVVGQAKRRFMPQDFTVNPSTTLKFTQWWHNSMAVYNGTPLAKTFFKYINAISSTPKNIAPEDFQTISDDGLGKFDQSDEEKEVEQPMPIDAIPLQVVPPLTTFRRKKHTRTLVSISEGPSKTLSSPKRKKACIADFDEDTFSYPRTSRMTRSKQAIREQERVEEKEKEKIEVELDDNAKLNSFARKRPSHRSSSTQLSDTSSSHQSPSQEVPIVEPIIEEHPATMVDLNQVGNLENFPDSSNPEASNVENSVDSPLVVPETLLPEFLETPTLQEFDKSVHAPIEISTPLVDTSIFEADVPLPFEETSHLETHSPEATTHMVTEKTTPSVEAILDLNLNGPSSSHMASSSTASFDVHAFSLKVKSFCDRICLSVQTPIMLSPMDELTVLLDPLASCTKSTFSNGEVQELIEIHQGFVILDFSFSIEYQLWDQFEICCKALAHLKPNYSELTQQLQHGIQTFEVISHIFKICFKNEKLYRWWGKTWRIYILKLFLTKTPIKKVS
ncbi:hypothetical protein RHMOL_Rhmol10G0118600 [Rhododendron molle]|uniref:Uncharacterized protein n=1 Tax=Rhododendron molle TaxID=49168 RepID=A0ACC0M1H2_RHOML|nr:hypothetical protein RHMOL_Rhmol10G0118600 [Rhododendron molle]